MREPFSKRARPWERNGLALRRLAGVPGGERLDPWSLAPKVGLDVIDGALILDRLDELDKAYLRGPLARRWSGGVLPIALPNGMHVCVLNPDHGVLRCRATLMEEIAHKFLNHTPTTICFDSDTLQVRDFNKDREDEAYGTGAAALVPWPQIFARIDQRETIPEMAAAFEVSEEHISSRIKVTGAYRLFNARQRKTA